MQNEQLIDQIEHEQEKLFELIEKQNSQMQNNLTALINEMKDKTFNYSLHIPKDMDVLYRQRNFTLEIHLLDDNGMYVENDNKIPVSVAVYLIHYKSNHQ